MIKFTYEVNSFLGHGNASDFCVDDDFVVQCEAAFIRGDSVDQRVALLLPGWRLFRHSIKLVVQKTEGFLALKEQKTINRL